MQFTKEILMFTYFISSNAHYTRLLRAMTTHQAVLISDFVDYLTTYKFELFLARMTLVLQQCLTQRIYRLMLALSAEYA